MSGSRKSNYYVIRAKNSAFLPPAWLINTKRNHGSSGYADWWRHAPAVVALLTPERRREGRGSRRSALWCRQRCSLGSATGRNSWETQYIVSYSYARVEMAKNTTAMQWKLTAGKWLSAVRTRYFINRTGEWCIWYKYFQEVLCAAKNCHAFLMNSTEESRDLRT